MSKTPKNTFAWMTLAISSFLVLGLVFYYNNAFYQEFLSVSVNYGPSTMPKRPADKKTIVEIYFNNASKPRVFESNMASAYRLERVLDAIGEAGALTFVTRAERIYSVKGKSGTWNIYKNGVLISTPVSGLNIVPGDRYSIRQEK